MQIPCNMSKCALQLACMRSNRKYWRCHWLHVWPLIICVHGIYAREWITAPGRFPFSFREAREFFKVPCIGLVKVEKLLYCRWQRLNVPTQGLRVALRQEQSPSHLWHRDQIPSRELNPRVALVIGRRANHYVSIQDSQSNYMYM